MSSSVPWKELLDSLESVMADKTLKEKADIMPLVTCIDKILDEYKSGEICSSNEELDRNLLLFISLLKWPQWNIVQTIAYGLRYLISQMSCDRILENDSLCIIVTSLLSHYKREVRDACAQLLGALSSVLGQSIFDEPKSKNESTTSSPSDAPKGQYITLILKGIESAKSLTTDKERSQSLEGHMTAIGYILLYSSSAKVSDFSFLFTILLNFSSFSDGDPSMASYVRRQACKGLERAMSSTSALAHFSVKDSQLSTRLLAAYSATIIDSNIDVRKSAAFMLTSFARLSARISTNETFMSSIIMETMIPIVSVADAGWERLQGTAFALRQFSAHSALVSNLTQSDISTLFSFLMATVNAPFSKSVEYGANAEAVHALTRLFLALYSAATHRIDSLTNATAALSLDGKSEELVFPVVSRTMTAASFKTDVSGSQIAGKKNTTSVLSSICESKESSMKYFTELINQFIYPAIEHAVTSSQPSLLDVGSTCVMLLLSGSPDIISIESRTYFSIKIYKNKFHRSLPIRDGAVKAWSALLAGQDEANATAEMTQNVLSDLGGSLTATSNSEVQESIFQALTELFSQPSPPAFLTTDPGCVSSLLNLLHPIFEDASEEAQAAALQSFAAYLSITAPSLDKISAWSNDQVSAMIISAFQQLLLTKTISFLLNDDEALAVGACAVVRALASHWKTKPVTPPELLLSLAGPTLATACNVQEAIRYAAYPACLALFGSLAHSLTQDPSLYPALLNSFSGTIPDLALTSSINDDEDKRLSSMRALSLILSSPGLRSDPSLWSAGFSPALCLTLQGLLDSENQTHTEIQSIAVQALYDCFSVPSASPLSSPIVQAQLSTVIRYFIFTLVAGADGSTSFNFDPQLISPAILAAEGDSVQDTFAFSTGQVDESKISMNAIPSGHLAGLTTMPTITLLAYLLPHLKDKSLVSHYAGYVHSLLSIYRKSFIIYDHALKSWIELVNKSCSELSLSYDSSFTGQPSTDSSTSFDLTSFKDKPDELMEWFTSKTPFNEKTCSIDKLSIFEGLASLSSVATTFNLDQVKTLTQLGRPIIIDESRKNFENDRNGVEESEESVLYGSYSWTNYAWLGRSPSVFTSMVEEVVRSWFRTLNREADRKKRFVVLAASVGLFKGEGVEEGSGSNLSPEELNRRCWMIYFLLRPPVGPWLCHDEQLRGKFIQRIGSWFAETIRSPAKLASSGDGIRAYWFAKMLTTLFASCAASELSSVSSFLQPYEWLLSQKWFTHWKAGLPAIDILNSLGHVLKASPKTELWSSTWSQIYADALSDEDIGLVYSDKLSLFTTISNFAWIRGDTSMNLPPPTKLGARGNEGFAAGQTDIKVT